MVHDIIVVFAVLTAAMALWTEWERRHWRHHHKKGGHRV
jgi:hypothetical protein